MNIGLWYWTPTDRPAHGSHVHGHYLIRYFREFGHRVNVCWYHDPNPLCRLYRRRQIGRFLAESDVHYFRLGNAGGRDLLSLVKLVPLLSRPLVWELNAVPEGARFSGWSTSRVNRGKFWHRVVGPMVDAGIGHTADQAAYLRGAGVRDVSLVRLGTDTRLLRPELRCEEFRRHYGDRFLVVWAGKTVGRWNDLGTVLWAARLLEDRRKDIAFLMVGDGRGLPGRLPSNVHCLGPVPYSQMGRVLASCDCGLALYRLEHGYDKRQYSPLKLYDYMASGLAVVVQRDGPVAAEVQHGRTGLLIEGTAGCLAETLGRLANCRELAWRLGMAGRRRAEAELDWRLVVRRKLAVIERAVARAGGARSCQHVVAHSGDRPEDTSPGLAQTEAVFAPGR